MTAKDTTSGANGALVRALNRGVYKVAAVKCPQCGERIETYKPKNGASVHSHRVAVLAQHCREAH